MDDYDLQLEYDPILSRTLGGIGTVVYHHINNISRGSGSRLPEFLVRAQSAIIQDRNLERQKMDLHGWFLRRYIGEKCTKVVRYDKSEK